ncbi:MAG: hypothetical protein WBE76_29220 [Terracidiphilus sp.]
MRALAGEAILTAWEKSRALPEQEAVLAVLALALTEKPVEELARLPLGERNALLLELRAMTLGRGMEGFAICPECGAQLEFSLDALELAKGLRTQPANAVAEFAGYKMRPANTLDLLASSKAESEEQARSILLARTVEANQPESNDAWLQSQPDTVAVELMDRFEELNAAAEIRVQLQCAVCRNRSLIDMDIARFLLREIAGAARRLMTEIHELAAAYGWSERSIAAMSGARRAAYLEMISA